MMSLFLPRPRFRAPPRARSKRIFFKRSIPFARQSADKSRSGFLPAIARPFWAQRGIRRTFRFFVVIPTTYNVCSRLWAVQISRGGARAAPEAGNHGSGHGAAAGQIFSGWHDLFGRFRCFGRCGRGGLSVYCRPCPGDCRLRLCLLWHSSPCLCRFKVQIRKGRTPPEDAGTATCRQRGESLRPPVACQRQACRLDTRIRTSESRKHRNRGRAFLFRRLDTS
jgi:hypothetical protein